MTRAEFKFFSRTLCRPARMRVLLPDVNARQSPPWATLYLLHGFSDDCDSFLRSSAIERYCEGLPLCVVLPDAGKSFYSDMRYGDAWWRFFTEELPLVTAAYLPIGTRTFLGGVSMGGYGALKLALHAPRTYERLYLFSPLVDIVSMAHQGVDRSIYPDAFDPSQMRLDLVFDVDRLQNSANDPLFVLEQPASALPPVSLFCGDRDFLRTDAHRLHALLCRRGIPVDFHEESGPHDWCLWEGQLAQMTDALRSILTDEENGAEKICY